MTSLDDLSNAIVVLFDCTIMWIAFCTIVILRAIYRSGKADKLNDGTK